MKLEWIQFLKPPFHYDANGGFIMDEYGNPVAEVRGWGLLQYEETPDQLQDKMGRSIAEGLNRIVADERTASQQVPDQGTTDGPQISLSAEDDDSLTCPNCHGWTQVMAGGDSVECPYCNGEGVVPPPPDPEEVIEKLCEELADAQIELERLRGEREALHKAAEALLNGLSKEHVGGQPIPRSIHVILKIKALKELLNPKPQTP